MSSAAAVAAASADELPAYETARDTRRGAVLPALIVVALVIMLGTPVVVAIVRGDTSYTQLFRSYPGQLTAIAATLGRALVDLAGWLTAGSLAVLMFLLARPGKDRVIIDDQPEWHVARWASIAWAVLAAAMIVIDAADANGLNVFDAIGSPALGYLLQISYLPVAWIVVAVLATIAAVVINFAVTWVGLLIPLWCSAIALLAPVVVGQILVGPVTTSAPTPEPCRPSPRRHCSEAASCSRSASGGADCCGPPRCDASGCWASSPGPLPPERRSCSRSSSSPVPAPG